jgi:MFS family permease
MGQLRASLGSMAAVLGNRDLARLIYGWAGTTVATWTFAIALAVYAFGQGGATAVGIAAVARLLPGALASPFAGLLGDRHSRRALLVSSSALCGVAIALAAGAVALGAPSWAVYACGGLFAIVSTAYIPAEGALIPLAARTPQELSAANVAHSQADNLGFLFASLASGVLLSLTSVETAFAVAAVAAFLTAAIVATLERDTRPDYQDDGAAGVLRETSVGLTDLMDDSRMRLVAIALTTLVLIEGAADVMVVVVALELLGLGEGSVGWMNAAWAIGALVAGIGLGILVHRGNLAGGLALGCLITGGGFALPGIWPAVPAAYLSYFLVGFGYACVEVAARTLLLRLGSDESLARVIAFLETSRLAATGLGAILAPVLVAVVGARGALLAFGALLPAIALLRWRALRELEIGTPVSERHFNLLRSCAIFTPLPVHTLEWLCRSAVEVDADAGDELIAQGDRGDRFYLIDLGEVEVIEDGVVRRRLSAGDGFGEIALLRDVPRTATVRATRDVRLLALGREPFIEAVTGHRRSHQRAEAVAEAWLARP